MPYQGVATMFGWLAAVLVFQGLKPGFHGKEDRVVFVHRFVAILTTVTELEEFSPPPRHL